MVWGKHGVVLVIRDKVMWWRGSHVIGKEAVELLHHASALTQKISPELLLLDSILFLHVQEHSARNPTGVYLYAVNIT